MLRLLRFHLNRGSTEEAVYVAEEFLRYNRDPRSLTVAGQLLAQHGQVPLAFRSFEQALLLNSRDKEIYLELGKLLGNLNKFDEAVRVWREGAAIDPTDRRFEDLIVRAESLKAQMAH